MKKTKYALLHSVIALLLCVSMLVGTTFAWFTDSVSSAKNQIIAGNLDIELAYSKDMGSWSSVAGKSDIVDPNALWEPGHTEVVYLKISNEGNLALKYSFNISFKDTVVGKSVLGNDIYLSQHLKYAVVDVDAKFADRDAARNAVKGVAVDLAGYSVTGTMAKDAKEKVVALVIFMPESVGNEANYRGDAIPRIDMGITLIATQLQGELDSFGPDYDAGAKYPAPQINFSASQTVAADAVENGALKQEMTVGNTSDEAYAEVPSGVKLAEGAESLTLTVKTMENSEANVTLEGSEVMTSLDVHMEGVAADNDVAMQIVLDNYLPKGLNSTSIALYHVENGNTVAMTAVAKAELDAHNEFYYDPATGTVILSLKSFSEITIIADEVNAWTGNINTDWYNTTDTAFTISNAEQLAGFGAIVDGTATGIKADNFAGKTIRLGANINLGGSISFNPIGYGYEHYTEGSTYFCGTFDGGAYDSAGNLIGQYTITGLYQSGWDLESKNTNGEDYTYYMSGGGLFASVVDATIKNLTISDAHIVMECIDMGILVGYSQGNCNYENINIIGSSIANYQRCTGGVVGEVSPRYDASGTALYSNHTFTNVFVGPTTTVGSLWGDFDAPVGGVIGGKWDDDNGTVTSKVVMTDCDVACKLDVYNDVTSAYQWYAYRRAGMLIGNTEEVAADGHTASASFLTCTNVTVHYGSWVNYHYCEFTNQDDSWQSNYPWVRVEAGLNCSAYSNPRYGHPVVNGATISGAHDESVHTTDDGHDQLIAFDQLYGGGQGVYGKKDHTGVTVNTYDYTVTYMNNYKALYVDYVNNDVAYDVAEKMPSIMIDGEVIDTWENAGSQANPTIAAGNAEDVVLYPVFADRFEIRFMGANNYCYHYETFEVSASDIALSDAGQAIIKQALADALAALDATERENYTVTWADAGGLFTYGANGSTISKSAAQDIVVYLEYTYTGGVALNPVDSDGDGDIDYYEVAGIDQSKGTNVVIPNSVNGIPVTTISNKAFAGFNDLVAVRIPENVETIGSNALEDGPSQYWPYTSDRSMITIYYEGTPAQWKANMDALYHDNALYTGRNPDVDTTATTKFDSSWDSGLGDGSRVFFLDENGKVDNTCYWELHKIYTDYINPNYIWVYHDHEYVQGGDHSGCSNSVSGEQSDYYNGTVKVDGVETVRPDTGYWP